MEEKENCEISDKCIRLGYVEETREGNRADDQRSTLKGGYVSLVGSIDKTEISLCILQ